MKNIFKFTIAMENNNIKIKLDYADNADVELHNMSLTALESFLKVTTALKNIAASVSPNVIFAIEKGSAAAAAYGAPHDIQTIFHKIDEAIEGDSEDEIITKNLRDIQSEIQNDIMRYQFFYLDIKLEEKIKNASKIKKKNSRNNYREEFRVLTGKFDEVGGSKINYHLEYGSGERETIDCTESEALELKDYLFKTISCLVIKKIADNDSIKPTFKHCVFLEPEQTAVFKEFITQYQEIKEILPRLDHIYTFFRNSNNIVKDMATMLKASSIIFHDVNELKTLLIISYGMRDNKLIKHYRELVNNNFKSQMNKY